MRIAIGADHAGYVLKSRLIEVLQSWGHVVTDHGTYSPDPVDYPPICESVGRAVVSGRADRGIVLGGSGQGEQIAANKVHGVRAALCNDAPTARLARLHNDANVLAMGGRVVAHHLAEEIASVGSRRNSKVGATLDESIRSRTSKGEQTKPVTRTRRHPGPRPVIEHE